MELANAQDMAREDEAMVMALHGENESFRVELEEARVNHHKAERELEAARNTTAMQLPHDVHENESLREGLVKAANSCISLQEELKHARAASEMFAASGEMLPIYEKRVSELLEELKTRDTEVACLKEELGEARGRYKETLYKEEMVDSLLWDDDDDGVVGDDAAANTTIEGNAEPGEGKLVAAAASSLQFGRKLAAAGRKVIEETVVATSSRQEETVFVGEKESTLEDGTMSPIEEENEVEGGYGDVVADIALVVGGDDVSIGEHVAEGGDSPCPSPAQDASDMNPPTKEDIRTEEALARGWSDPNKDDTPTSNDDINAPRKGAGWGVRRLGASLKAAEEKMRTRQQLFREQQVKLLKEQVEQAEMERLKAGPGLGEVLLAKTGIASNKRATAVETYAALESLDKSRHTADGGMDTSSHGGGMDRSSDPSDSAACLDKSSQPTTSVDEEEDTATAVSDNSQDNTLESASMEQPEGECLSVVPLSTLGSTEDGEVDIKMDASNISKVETSPASSDVSQGLPLVSTSNADELGEMGGANNVTQEEPCTPKSEESEIPGIPVTPEEMYHIGTITIED